MHTPDRLTVCPRCGCKTAHITDITDLVGGSTVLVDVLIWCTQCDDNEHPYEQATT